MHTLHHCFSTTEWYMFQDNNMDTYSDAENWIHWQMYRWRCTEDYCTDIALGNGQVSAKPKARTHVYILGDLEEYRKSRYAFRKAISSAKRQYRNKFESNYQVYNIRNMWAGLKTLRLQKEDRQSRCNVFISPRLTEHILCTLYPGLRRPTGPGGPLPSCYIPGKCV